MKFVDLAAQYRLYREEIDAQMAEVLADTSFIMGAKVKELEKLLAGYVGARHGIGVSSGTDALMTALMACEVGPGDEVITTPFSFFATAEAIALLGARPVFVDIEPRTYNLDADLVEAAVTPRTKAVMPVSLYGQCPRMEIINEVAGRHKLPVIEDACQSFGAERHGRRSCGLTSIGCTSFFPSKPLGCYGDGGMIFTDDDRLAGIMREIMVHGQSGRYRHVRLGLNARLDTLQAAVLLGKFPHFAEELVSRRLVAAHYEERLSGLTGLVAPVTAPGNSHVYAQYSVEVADRDGLAAFLGARGIPTAVHYPSPLHLQPALAYLGLPEGSFPAAERAAARIISLPMHPFLTEDEVEQVAEGIRKFLVP